MEMGLVADGRVVGLVTRGNRTGSSRAVAVGFVEREDGSVVVAAGSPRAAWAANLLDDPACRVTLGTRTFDAIAEPLEGAESAAAVRDLILRYGTPSERLGRGPVFRLRPTESRPTDRRGTAS
jgi:deazaflavin-dependent oxidoreductase (nitroreductase family)